MRNVVRFLGLGVLALVLATGMMSSTTAWAAGEVLVGHVAGGTGALSPIVIKQQKLAEKNGVTITWRGFADPAPLHQALQLAQIPVSSTTGIDAIIRSINAGRELQMVYPHIRNHMSVLVRKDAPYKSLADLKGKRLGIYTWNTGSTATLVSIYKNLYGLDMRKDLQVIVAQGPAMPGLLEKEQLEAIHLFEPLPLKLVLSGKFRVLVATRDEWLKVKGGGEQLFAGIAVDAKWARENSDTLKRLVKTFKESFEYIRSHPDVYVETGFIELVGLKATPEIVRLFQERITPIFQTQFDAAFIKAQDKFLQDMVENEIVAKIPPNWYSLEYAPK